MEAYLNELAKHIFENNGHSLGRVCVIFPGRRAGVWFRKYLASLIEKPVWMPDVFAIEDFVFHKTGFSRSDQVQLLIHLYKIYRKNQSDSARPFYDFISWGNMLLSDFDELDQYMADGEKLFLYLDELKAIENWNPTGEPLTEFERNYLKFFNSLSSVYSEFTAGLVNNKEGYLGLVFKYLIHNLSTISFGEWDRIIFAGFNALTRAEEQLISNLVSIGKAYVHWDADKYYIDNEQQEAGHFLRKYYHSKLFGEFNALSNNFVTDHKTINVIGVAGNVGQAKEAAGILSNQCKFGKTADSTALILVDESLLQPVLNSIPNEIGEYNVTMGFPFKNSNAFSLIFAVIQLVKRVKPEQNNDNTYQEAGRSAVYYFRDIQRFINHPIIFPVLEKNLRKVNNKKNRLLSKPYYSGVELVETISVLDDGLAKAMSPIFKDNSQSASGLARGISEMIQYLLALYQPNNISHPVLVNHHVNIEYLRMGANLSMQLYEISSDPELELNIDTIESIFTGLATGLKLPFFGEPLQGLQVMGMLETRLLDFQNLIILSVNEGFLPKGKQRNSLIPDEVRSQFGLPRYAEHSAVFAYHFYRLIQRSQNVWLLYNSEGDELGGGEVSRFVRQLNYELPGVNPNVVIKSQIISTPPESVLQPLIKIRKDELIMQRLEALAQRGLSPTALAMYLSCNLKFYYAQVLGIREPETITESIDAASMGEIIHEVLHQLYSKFSKSVIGSQTIDIMLSGVSGQVQKSLKSRYSEDQLVGGRNLLLINVAENLIIRFLEAEKKYLEKHSTDIVIQMLEEELFALIKIETEETGSLEIKIYGKADRIDSSANLTRIIDYKTGRVDDSELVINQMDDLLTKQAPAKLLQIFMYAYMFAQMHPDRCENFISGIISLRKSSAYLMPSTINESKYINKETLEEFERVMKQLLAEIFDKRTAFEQTPNSDECKKCPYTSICNVHV